MSDDKSFGKGFNLDYDQRNIISSALNGVTEIIQRGSYRVNHIPRAAIRMNPDDILQIFFAEHLALGIMSFPDAVCADNDDLPRPDLTLKLVIGGVRGNPQGQTAAVKFFKSIRLDIIKKCAALNN